MFLNNSNYSMSIITIVRYYVIVRSFTTSLDYTNTGTLCIRHVHLISDTYFTFIRTPVSTDTFDNRWLKTQSL